MAKPRDPKKYYWDAEQDEAIIRYCATQDKAEREKIFNEELYQPFQKLVENVFNTFKFEYVAQRDGPLDAQKDCISHLVMQLDKFDPERGKSFSYFSLIAKNYLIALNNWLYKKRQQNNSIEEMSAGYNKHDEDGGMFAYEDTLNFLKTEDSYHKHFDYSEFTLFLVKSIKKNKDSVIIKKADEVVVDEFLKLLVSAGDFEKINKKIIYDHIKTVTGVRVQRVTLILKRIKCLMEKLRAQYIADGCNSEEVVSSDDIKVDITKIGNLCTSNHKITDTIFTFRHEKTGKEFTGTRKELCELCGISISQVSGVLYNKNSVHAHGWYWVRPVPIEKVSS